MVAKLVTLPWPDKRLSPNARQHWARLRLVKAQAKNDAAWATRAIRPGSLPDGPIPLKITFYPPDNRRRDRDNMQASLKAALDGVAQALGVDDYRFLPSYEFAPPEKPGRVEIEVGG